MDYEENNNSLPYIDDLETEDELLTNQCSYNLKIIENYQNKNRNIEISDQFLDDINSSLSPVAPLAEETEITESKLTDSKEELRHHINTNVPKQTELKLIIKGCHSTISIQGLDNKSSIIFKRRREQLSHGKVMGNGQRKDKNTTKSLENTKPLEKPKKGRWKMLTRSLISKSTKFEKRIIDERYPKYVLLKDEEETEKKVKENYPKMVVLNDNYLKTSISDNTHQTKTLNNVKSDFNLKKSFNNKTKPIVPLEKVLSKEEKDSSDKKLKNEKVTQKHKTPLTERSFRNKGNLTIRNKVVVERNKSFTSEKKNLPPPPPPQPNFAQNETHVVFNVNACSPNQAQVFNDIQGLFEDTLKLYPDLKPSPREFICTDYDKMDSNDQPQIQSDDFYSALPQQFCQFPCHNLSCYSNVMNQPPVCLPEYNPYSRLRYSHKNSNTQTNENEFCEPSRILKGTKEHKVDEKEIEVQSLPLGLLSSLFPRVVIIKTFQSENLDNEGEVEKIENVNLTQISENIDNLDSEKKEGNVTETLEVPLPDLTIKSKMTQQEQVETDTKFTELTPNDVLETMNCLTLNESSSSDEEHKTKTDESEATEYLHFQENDSDNEVEKPPLLSEIQEKTDVKDIKKLEECHKDDESLKNLSLTKIGYKMYDNLTKLSLNREKEVIEKPEIDGCGCKGNIAKKSTYNIIWESNKKIIKVSVPEEQLNFQVVNSEGSDIQIGLSQFEEDSEIKKLVKKNELWHPDNGRERQKTVVLQNKQEKDNSDTSKDLQKIKVSLTNNKEVVLSIEMNDNEKDKKNILEKTTKEMKIGTDDCYLAGGDFVGTIGTNYRNLSPRTGQLLKNLQEKLELGEKERKLLEKRINDKLENGMIPGIFLVKQISPKSSPKVPSEVLSLKKLKKVSETPEKRGYLREYYCEECLATMRIFEDENPSVKSMVDKFERIIQLESY